MTLWLLFPVWEAAVGVVLKLKKLPSRPPLPCLARISEQAAAEGVNALIARLGTVVMLLLPLSFAVI